MLVHKQSEGKKKKQEFEQSNAGLSALGEVIPGPGGIAEAGVWFGLPQIPLGSVSPTVSFIESKILAQRLQEGGQLPGRFSES